MRSRFLALILIALPTLASAQVGPLVRIDSNYGFYPSAAFDASGKSPEPDPRGIAVEPGGAFDLFWYYYFGCGPGGTAT